MIAPEQVSPPLAESPPKDRSLLLGILASTILLMVLFAPVLTRMVREWIDLEEMGHGFFAPVVAGWIAWNKREELERLPFRRNYWGLALVVWGFVQMIVANTGAEMFLARTAFLISFIGILLTLGGWPLIRALLLPLFLLTFMIRWPTILYTRITFPLQLLASVLSEWMLNLIGIPALRDGNIIELPTGRLSVVEACSGIRSLLSLSFLSIVYAYFFDSKVWMRVVLLVATVPIALLANASRVTMTAILTEYAPAIASGIFHTIEGWLVFVVALIILFLVHQAINRLYSFWTARS